MAVERTDTSFPSGGDECAATLFFPTEPAEDDVPAVVLAQGFTGTRMDGIPRFAERFADYALLSFRLSGDRLKTSAELIDDKIDFLADYPRVSRERGQAANMRPEAAALLWDSDNVSGLERRVGRLLGGE